MGVPEWNDTVSEFGSLDVLRMEEGLITEIVTFEPETFPLFGLPLSMETVPETSTSAA